MLQDHGTQSHKKPVDHVPPLDQKKPQGNDGLQKVGPWYFSWYLLYTPTTKFIIYSLEKSGKHDGKLLAKSCCYEKRYYIHGSSMEGAALFFNEVTHVNTSMFFLNICWGICIYLQKIHKQYIKCKVREIFNR